MTKAEKAAKNKAEGPVEAVSFGSVVAASAANEALMALLAKSVARRAYFQRVSLF